MKVLVKYLIGKRYRLISTCNAYDRTSARERERERERERDRQRQRERGTLLMQDVFCHAVIIEFPCICFKAKFDE